MNEPDRVVFDCNVFFQSIISPHGPAGKCLDAVRHGTIRLFVSEQVFAELREICLRPPLVRKFRLTPERVEAYILDVELLGTLIEQIPHVFDYDRDPDDEHYIDLAVAVKAELIVSRDNDLLVLSAIETPEGASFHQQFPELTILTPEELLQRIAQSSA